MSAFNEEIRIQIMPASNAVPPGGLTSNSNQTTSDSQQSDESETVRDPPSQDADGKTTFKPTDLNIGNDERATQDWIFNERDGFAEMRKGRLLDINGSMIPAKGKTYKISFKLSMNKQKSLGWEDPVSLMAKMGEEGKYEYVKVNLSQLGEDIKEFPSEKFQIEFKSDVNTGNNETRLYFGLYELETGKQKGGLRIHEAIVQEVTAEDSASSSKTSPEDSKDSRSKSQKS